MRSKEGIYFLALVALALLITLSGCTKKIYVPVESVRYTTDTLRTTIHRVDSVLMRDSVTVYRSGDTVEITRWRERWHKETLRDTVYRARVDSIDRPVPYPVEKRVEIEKPLRWWQTALILIGGAGIVAILIILGLQWLKTKVPRV